MIQIPTTVKLPLKTDEHGVIRVSDTWVTLHTLLNFYRSGETPEQIREGFPTISLADIYTIIAYYLANQAEIDQYLDEIDHKAHKLRDEWKQNATDEQKARLEHFKSLKRNKLANE